MKYVLLLLPFVGGCALLEHGETVETIGEAGEQVGAALTLTAPQIGVIVVAASGILLAVGKLLSILKEKK